MTQSQPPIARRSRFPGLFWLAVVFEFFERGSYYGMMSVLSVYLTDVLHVAKEDVGLLKSTIQPLLYFLPIVSGALADRFGYRRTLLVAFTLLGGGYFLTSQADEYATVFLSLAVMGVGAGTFKPIISGTIARCTDATNSTLGFGIFYWSINLGAFLFPLFLVPYLKNTVGWSWVIAASAIGTGVLLLPTLFLFREPPRPKDAEALPATRLFQTLANAFEIVYSPLVLLHATMRRNRAVAMVVVGLGALFAIWGLWDYSTPPTVIDSWTEIQLPLGDRVLHIEIKRDMTKAEPYKLEPERPVAGHEQTMRVDLTVFDPRSLEAQLPAMLERLRPLLGLHCPDVERLGSWIRSAARKISFELQLDPSLEARAEEYRSAEIGDVGPTRQHRLSPAALAHQPFELVALRAESYRLRIAPSVASDEKVRAYIFDLCSAQAELSALTAKRLDTLLTNAQKRPFLQLYVALIALAALALIGLAPRFANGTARVRALLLTAPLVMLLAIIWGLPGLSFFARVLASVLTLPLLSLYALDYRDLTRFFDHGRFLLMIVIYAGFWVLYFQMFDSVLWYVQAYVDPLPLNEGVNSVLATVGLESRFRFDVEHVTVINAGTIILLQLLVSYIVRKTRALPTMIAGIAMATCGMAILAISSGIWVFIAGIVIFSIGEMTAHPKFISYIGQTAPKARVALYMGYLFLYGVIGSSIGGVMGARLYVKFVDERDEPRTLWLIFAAIGLATIVGLLLYNRLIIRRSAAQADPGAA